MFCKWCGLESETKDACSWCRKPFSTAAASPHPASEQASPQPTNPTPAQPVGPSRPAPDIDNFDDLPPPIAGPIAFSAAAVPAAPTPPTAASGPHPPAFDDIDDDLSPFPFGGGAYQPPPLPPRSATPAGPPPPTFAPPPARSPSAAPPSAAAPPDVVQPAPPAVPAARPTLPPLPPAASAPAAPVGMPAAPPLRDRPAPPPPGGGSLEAIPIRLKTGGAAPPPVVPIRQAAPPATPAPALPPAATPGPTSSPAGSAPLVRPEASPPASVPPPAAPLYSRMAADDSAAPPIAARAPQPFGDEAGQDLPPGPVDLGLQPLAPEAEEDDAPIGLSAGRRLDLGSSPPAPPLARPTPAPAPGRPAAPSLSTAIGRKWYCRWCGMDSDDPNTCTWCRRDIRGTPAPTGKPAHVTITHGPVRGKPVRQPVARSKEKAKDKGRKEPLPDLLKGGSKPETTNGTGLPKAAPQLGTFQPAKSKYYGDQIVDPVSGAHYDADTGKTTDTPVEAREAVETNDLRQLGIYAGLFVVLLGIVYGVGVAAVRQSTGGYFAVLASASFLAGILMPLLRVAPWPKDDAEDVGWAMGLIPLFGPFAGTMGYGVLGVVRQDVNPAVLGVFITSLLLRIVLDAATGHGFGKMVPFSEMSGLVLGAQVMPFVTLAGWYASEVFHKPDE